MATHPIPVPQPEAGDTHTAIAGKTLAEKPSGADRPLPWQAVTAINVGVFGAILWFVAVKDLVASFQWGSLAYFGGLLTVVASLVIGSWVSSNASRQVFALTVLVVPVLLSVVVGIVSRVGGA